MYRLDIFREPQDGETWIRRRDERIRLPYERIIETTADGVPYLVPEIMLLFKATHSRQKDDADFHGILTLLSPERRAWLRSTLASIHPDNRWLDALA